MRNEISFLELSRVMNISTAWVRKNARRQGWNKRKPRPGEGRHQILEVASLPQYIKDWIAEHDAALLSRAGSVTEWLCFKLRPRLLRVRESVDELIGAIDEAARQRHPKRRTGRPHE